MEQQEMWEEGVVKIDLIVFSMPIFFFGCMHLSVDGIIDCLYTYRCANQQMPVELSKYQLSVHANH